MPRYILRFETRDGPRYLEWSTVVDAPVSALMPIETFRAYYQGKYGTDGIEYLGERLARCDQHGTSAAEMSFGQDTLESTIAGNRAGPNETELTLEEIIAHYSPGGAAVS